LPREDTCIIVNTVDLFYFATIKKLANT